MQMIFILKLFQEQSKANRAAEEAKRAAVIALPFGASNKQKSTQSWHYLAAGTSTASCRFGPKADNSLKNKAENGGRS